MSGLDFSLVYLLAAVLGVVLLRSLKLPSMLGYLLTGTIVGPHLLGMMENNSRIRSVAEFGVVFLMFVLGLEFNLSKLRTMRRHVLGLGLLQVAATMLLATAAILGLRWLVPGLWQIPWQGALALSGVLTMSSTAIVVKLMADRMEVDSEHGKRVVGVLLFQDLTVVPLLILIPALATPGSNMATTMVLAMLKAGMDGAFAILGHRSPACGRSRDPGKGGFQGPSIPGEAIHEGPESHHRGEGLDDAAPVDHAPGGNHPPRRRGPCGVAM